MRIVSKENKTAYVSNQLLQGLKKLGFRYVLLVYLIVLDYAVSFLKPKKFKFKGKTYRYFYHPYNHTWVNERAVEIPIAYREITTTQGTVLEIGNVMRRYYPFTHDVVDKYEKFPGVVNQDVLDFKINKKYDLIISVSTMEHVGWDEIPKDAHKIHHSIENLRKHLSPGGKIVFTVPMGYNPYLDDLIRKSNLFKEKYFLKRKAFGQWKQCKLEEVRNYKYTEEISAKVLAVLVMQ